MTPLSVRPAIRASASAQSPGVRRTLQTLQAGAAPASTINRMEIAAGTVTETYKARRVLIPFEATAAQVIRGGRLASTCP